MRYAHQYRMDPMPIVLTPRAINRSPVRQGTIEKITTSWVQVRFHPDDQNNLGNLSHWVGRFSLPTMPKANAVLEVISVFQHRNASVVRFKVSRQWTPQHQQIMAAIEAMQPQQMHRMAG